MPHNNEKTNENVKKILHKIADYENISDEDMQTIESFDTIYLVKIIEQYNKNNKFTIDIINKVL
jgi:predicted Zn-dependent protease with MMP-like domain